MYSKIKLSFGVLILMSIISSCGWIRDKPKAKTTFQTESMNCLNKLSGQIDKLFAGQYTDSQEDQSDIKSAFSCVDYALYNFGKNTRGETLGYFTATELRNFANRYLDPDKQLNRTFVDSIFSLKAAIWGGNATTLTQSEILKLRKTVNEFQEYILPLAGKIKILLKPKEAGIEERKTACKELDVFVGHMSELLENNEGAITWRVLETFVSELEAYNANGKPNVLTILREQLPLIQYFKLLAVGGDEYAIEKSKWRPILISVSSAFNALNFSANTVQLLEDLRIDIQSTPQEQRRAVTRITALLEALKEDKSLYTHDTIVLIADNWAKALLANSFLFPSTQGGLAIQTFLNSPVLRKLAGYIADKVQSLDKEHPDPLQVMAISEYVQKLIEQAADAIEPNSENQGTFSISSFKEYASSIHGLFTDEKSYQIFVSAVDIAQNLREVLLGKTLDTVKASEFKDLIKKLTDLYMVWNNGKTNFAKAGMMDSLSQSLEILTREPYAFNIKASVISESLKKTKDLTEKAGINADLPWNKMDLWVSKGFELKGLLLGSSSQTIYSGEIRKITHLLEPFRGSDEFSVQLEAFAKLLKSDTFASVRVDALMDIINPIYDSLDLPKPPFELSAQNVGLAKALVLGGAKERVDQSDYSLMAYAASRFVRDILPVMDALPKNFTPGINSKTMELAEVSMKTFAEFIDTAKASKPTLAPALDYKNIKELVLQATSSMELNVDPKHLDDFLIGFPYRVFQGKKDTKPTTLAGSISSKDLALLIQVMQGLRDHLIDLERVYQGVDLDQVPLEKSFLTSQLKDPELLQFIAHYKPQLMGPDHVLKQPKKGEVFTKYYYFDLAYKSLVHELLKVIMPAYYCSKTGDQEKDSERKECSNAKAPVRWNMGDLTDILKDINDLITDLELSYGYEPAAVTAGKRMVTINAFTQTGNGDSYADPVETVDFLTMTFGGTLLMSSTRKILAEACEPGTPWKKVRRFDAACFHKNYFTGTSYQKIYGDTLPQMADAVSAMNPKDLEEFRISTLITAKTGLIDKKVFELEDVQAVALLPEYIENDFIRLDTNKDAILQFSEVMGGFPLFCEQVQSAGGSKLKGSCKPGEYPNQIEAIYGYMIMNGEAPRGPKPGDSIWRKLKEGMIVLKWFKTWRRLPKDPIYRDSVPPQINRKDIMSIFANLALAAPIDVPPEADQP